MKKIILLLLTGIALSLLVSAQTTIVLQPDAIQGKDAYLRSLSPNDNFGAHPDLAAHAWTFDGNEVIARGIIDFDLSGIPGGATINAARLSLYSYNSPANGAHSTLSGSNESTISRVTSAWDENTVTWNNQPSTTAQNQVFLPASTNSIQDYPNIDVTGMVQDMIDDPGNSHGFLFKLVTEQYYRRIIFASSDNADPALHPKLEVTYTKPVSSDSCFTLRPAGDSGKDAYLRSLSPNDNFGTHPDFSAHAWTFDGNEVIARGIIDFDLSGIPAGATINAARLSLYSYNSPAQFGAHSTLSGSNESTISRVTSSWDENTVTWNNQPSTTTQNQVLLPASTNPIQDYPNIDVTDLVQDMIDDPGNSHGFLFKLVTEQYYRRMLFASSDNADPALHPKLEICYAMATPVSESIDHTIEFNLFPVPASDAVTIDLKNIYQESVSIGIFNSMGQLVEHQIDIQPVTTIDVSRYAKGLYFVRAYSGELVSTKKLIIE